MQLELYNGIKAALDEIADVKTVALYNNQFQHSNMVRADGSAKGDEAAFKYPACFINFGDATYKDLLGGDQLIENQIVELYIGVKGLQKEDLSFLTLKQAINKAIHGLSTSNWNRLSRISEDFSDESSNVYVFVMRYQVSGRDSSARRPKVNQQVEDVQLVLEKEIEISTPPTAVRTDVPLNP